MQYPKRFDTHVTETKSFKIFSNIIPDEWIIREATERDYGIDCYIEICEDGFVTGKMLHIQLKGTEESFKGKRSITCSNISVSSFSYWNKIPVPVVLVYIDVENELALYSNIKKYIRRNYSNFLNENLKSVTFKPVNNINRKNVSLLNIIYEEEVNRVYFENQIIDLLTYFDYKKNIIDEHWCRDCFMSLEGEDLISFISLYKSGQYFATIFNIAWTSKTLDEMSKEGKAMFGKHGLLFEKQAAEFIINYIPIFEKTIKKCLETVLKSENDYWSKKHFLTWSYIRNRDYISEMGSMIDAYKSEILRNVKR